MTHAQTPLALPIDGWLAPISETLASRRALILCAAPGAGKTTRLPLHLLASPALASQRIVMLQPRRLAARTAARFIAAALGEPIGQTVGHAMRFDTRIGPTTRLEIVTEGVMLRYLQADPALERFGLVIFDEFHERSLDADLALALCLEARRSLRPDLAILVMSATLDIAPLVRLLPDAAVLEVPGRQHPVSIEYRHRPAADELAAAIAAAVRDGLADGANGVLAFLPGAREIRDVADALRRQGLPVRCAIRPLLGALSDAEQRQAVLPAPPGHRKIVLATNIAETSLTIDGIDTVVDSGLARRNLFSARNGMARLETVTISRASATQRAGRAGRRGQGRCIRLWPVEDERGMAPNDPPEIATADLMPLALELALWGSRDAASLGWLTPPPPGPLASARSLLRQLGAIDGDNLPTPLARRLARWPVHPRLAAMLEAAGAHGELATAIALAALLSARDPWPGRPSDDLSERLRLLADGEMPPPLGQLVGQLRRHAGQAVGEIQPDRAGLCLAAAYPDRLARWRQPGSRNLKLSNGRGARLVDGSALATAPLIVIAELDDRGADALVRRGAALDEPAWRQRYPDQIETTERISWCDRQQRVRAEQTERVGALVLVRRDWPSAPQPAIERCLLEAVRGDLSILPWDDEARSLLARLRFRARVDGSHRLDWSDAALAAEADDWLAGWLAGMRSASDLGRIALAQALRGRLDHAAQQHLDRVLPASWETPLGRRIAIDYASDPPSVAVPLQEVLGLRVHPQVLNGKLALALHLLSPASRLIQVTTDIAGFWRGSYAAVRKDLRGRYPKHPWPEDPAAAAPWRPGLRR